MAIYKCPQCNGEVHDFRTQTRHSAEYGDETFDVCPLCHEEVKMVELKICPVCWHEWREPDEPMCPECKVFWKRYFRETFMGVAPAVREYINDLLDGVTIDEFIKK